ncbi:hypothetical protein DPMN_024010 [Dreissena polymorpha]|uniref:Uncharacterized protein n=1 Tax=Dreissena polymorpha TaxID=45954 RepID=A0A9D4LLV9_DREPO|nr:hypothetical protein DPMN_024010 [Dreissena polymorpha]
MLKLAQTDQPTDQQTNRQGKNNMSPTTITCTLKLTPYRNFKFETSPKLKAMDTITGHYDINVRAVWGSIVTGNGASHLKEVMATMGAPNELLAAGAEERRLAIEDNCFHQGVPAITVVADGVGYFENPELKAGGQGAAGPSKLLDSTHLKTSTYTQENWKKMFTNCLQTDGRTPDAE